MLSEKLVSLYVKSCLKALKHTVLLTFGLYFAFISR